MQIILVGGPASGKSTVSQVLAEALNLPCIDTDQLIEEMAKLSIPDIFATQGEDQFRALETKALKQALTAPAAVIATGGGIVKRAENRDLLTAGSNVVYLAVTIETQLKRTADNTSRPLLQGDKPAILKRLQQERDSWYREVATVIVNADQPLDELIAEIKLHVIL